MARAKNLSNAMLRDSIRLDGGLPTNPVNFVSPIAVGLGGDYDHRGAGNTSRPAINRDSTAGGTAVSGSRKTDQRDGIDYDEPCNEGRVRRLEAECQTSKED